VPDEPHNESVPAVTVSPAKPVQVLIDEVWHDGTLGAWRRTDGRWRGYVRWSAGGGLRHSGEHRVLARAPRGTCVRDLNPRLRRSSQSSVCQAEPHPRAPGPPRFVPARIYRTVP
jgi:hypothetical protein